MTRRRGLWAVAAAALVAGVLWAPVAVAQAGAPRTEPPGAAALPGAAPATTVTLSPSPTPTPSPTVVDGVFVEVNPGTAEPGTLVGVRASCPDNTVPATVESEAFGQVTVRPQFDFLTAAVTIPVGTEAARYVVTLTCADGASEFTTLRVVGVTRPSRGPATGFGGASGSGAGTLLLFAGLALVGGGVALGVIRLRRHLGA